KTEDSQNGVFSIRDRAADQAVAYITVSGGSTPQEAVWQTNATTSVGASMRASSVTEGNLEIDTARSPASVTFAADETTGMRIAMSFATSAGTREQNEVAAAFRNGSMEVQRSAVFNASTSSVSVSYNVERPSSLGGEYAMLKDENSAGGYRITNSSGNTVARFTVSGGADRISEADIRASSVTEGVKVTGDVAFYDKDGNIIAENTLSKYIGVTSADDIGSRSEMYFKEGAPALYDSNGNVAVTVPYGFSATFDIPGSQYLKYGISNEEGSPEFAVEMEAMSSHALGTDNIRIDGSDGSNARYAGAVLDEALNKVRTQRESVNMMEDFLNGVIERDNMESNTQVNQDGSVSVNARGAIITQAKLSFLAQANIPISDIFGLLW
ncbi:MAG: hypothetical protein K6F00_11515, partial [Lachnospiraceae bacterium]|nr:hypothetical protein [Lachnospiraceae bacterium]